jgi:hypothetical protein
VIKAEDKKNESCTAPEVQQKARRLSHLGQGEEVRGGRRHVRAALIARHEEVGLDRHRGYDPIVTLEKQVPNMRGNLV